MKTINISVRDKLPVVSAMSGTAVTDNKYHLIFEFDDEWVPGLKSIVVVGTCGEYAVYPTETDEVEIELGASRYVSVGVIQDSVATSRPCEIIGHVSIKRLMQKPIDPPEPDVWTYITEQIRLLNAAKLSPIAATPEMTQPVGRDEQGRLWTPPSAGGGGNTNLPIYTLEWMQANYPDLIVYHESAGAYAIEFTLRNDDMSLNPPDGMYMLWPQNDALAYPVNAIRIVLWDVEKDSYVMLKGFSDYGYLSMIRRWTNNSNILGMYSISSGAFVDELTINADGTYDYTDYDFVSGQYVQANLAKTLRAPDAPVVGEVVVVKSLNEDGTVKETETVPMAGGGGSISVSYDDTTGELTIASADGGVAYDEETGNLTIGG